MNLKLKQSLEEAYIYVPFTNSNVMGKFIDEGLYPHLYELEPEFFDVVADEPVKGLKQKIEEVKKEI
jgi:hypothetical protein